MRYNAPHVHGVVRTRSPSKVASWESCRERRATHTRISAEERERGQWRCSLAHLLRSVAGLNNRQLNLVVDLAKARAQGPPSLGTCSLRTRVPIRSRCPGTTSLNKRLRVITCGADDTCTCTVQIGYIGTVWPRFLACMLAARLASWYHLAWSSLLLSCQANRLILGGALRAPTPQSLILPYIITKIISL